MKTKILFSAILSVLFLTVPSCKLEEDLSRISTPDNFFRKFSECQSAVNSCYIPLKSIYTYTFMIATECTTDILSISSGTLDCTLDISPVKPRFGSTVWTQCYLGIQRCNFAIRGITNSELNDEAKDPLLGEAETLRAYYYYLLTSFFGDVPYYEDDVADQETLIRISKLGRMSAVETRNKLIEKLQHYAPLMEQIRTSENKENRLGAPVAWMLIGKMAMWNKYWNTALDALLEVEKIYGSLSTYEFEYNVFFRNKNTPESIMEIQHTYAAGGLNYTSNVALICTPHPRTNGTAIFDGVEIDIIGNEPTVWTSMRPTSFFCQNLQTKTSTDIRARVNMAWDYNGKTFNSVSSIPWMGPKFWCPDLKSGNDSNNYTTLRYADAVLMIAECYCMLENEEKSMEYLNMVKTRAEISLYTRFKSYEHLMDEIRNERARELIGEFQRKFDLVRWGIYYQSALDYNAHGTLKANIKPCHEYYPIPDTEVVYSGNNLDNKAYNAYGL